MIDINQARELLAQAVETQGRDFVYKARGISGPCSYVPMRPLAGGRAYGPVAADNRTKTGCLIGVALDIAGETRHHVPDVSSLSINALWIKFPDMLTREAAEYFTEAQDAQDTGRTWGEAYDRAERSTNPPTTSASNV